MKIFTAIKRFFKDIKDAIKRLFGFEDKTEDVTEKNTEIKVDLDENGNVESITKIEVVNPNGTWKDIFHKINNKVKEGAGKAIDWISEHPYQFFFGGTVGCASIGSIFKAFDRVGGFFDNARERREAKRTISDVYNSEYGRATYTTNRPINRRERNYIYSQTANGRAMPDVLREMGLA